MYLLDTFFFMRNTFYLSQSPSSPPTKLTSSNTKRNSPELHLHHSYQFATIHMLFDHTCTQQYKRAERIRRPYLRLHHLKRIGEIYRYLRKSNIRFCKASGILIALSIHRAHECMQRNGSGFPTWVPTISHPEHQKKN